MKHSKLILGICLLSLVGCAPALNKSYEPLELGSSRPVGTDTESSLSENLDFSVEIMAGFPEGAAKYKSPWKNAQTRIVIDAYEGNSIDWGKMAQDKRVAGVIHRSSIGLRTDAKYAERKALAIQRGYLWGAYHLGRSGDPIAQAKYFLKVIGNSRDTLMVLDLEDTSNSAMMNTANAAKFMAYIFEQTGRVPVVYANHSVTKTLNSSLKNNVHFKKSKLWYARFRSDIPDFPKGIWSGYFLWQFSSEINCSRTGSCLYNVPGTAFDMDVNVYYGNLEDLRKDWMN